MSLRLKNLPHAQTNLRCLSPHEDCWWRSKLLSALKVVEHTAHVKVCASETCLRRATGFLSIRIFPTGLSSEVWPLLRELDDSLEDRNSGVEESSLDVDLRYTAVSSTGWKVSRLWDGPGADISGMG